MNCSSRSRFVAAMLVVTLAIALNPAWAANRSAGLLGRVLQDDARTPFEGAVLQLTGPSDEVIKSEPTGADGKFVLSDLPPGTYRCVIATDEGLYQITTSLALEAGQTRSVQLALQKSSPVAAGVGSATGGGGAMNRDAAAALIGFGVVLGTLAVASALESDPKKYDRSSPSEPTD